MAGAVGGVVEWGLRGAPAARCVFKLKAELGTLALPHAKVDLLRQLDKAVCVKHRLRFSLIGPGGWPGKGRLWQACRAGQVSRSTLVGRENDEDEPGKVEQGRGFSRAGKDRAGGFPTDIEDGVQTLQQFE